MRRMKKWTAYMLVAIMALVTVGCGSKGKEGNSSKHNGGKEVEISYWNSGLGTDYLDAMVKAFNEEQSDYYVYYNAAAGGSSTAGFGLADVDSVDLYMGTKIYDTSQMEPIDDILNSVAEGDKKPLKEKFHASYLETEQAEDGHYYSLPWGGGLLSIMYNKELFQKAGITTLPRTTSELTVVCDTLYEKGITPLTHCTGTEGGGYWTSVMELWQAQYDGIDYFKNTFYKCTDENGTSPSKDVLTRKDGRYEVLKAMESITTPEYVLAGSNSQDHITMQTLFLQTDIGMLVNGSWLANEMKSVGDMGNYGVMKAPVISSITDKLTTVKSDKALRDLVSAIDAVTDGEKAISEYQSGDNYIVNGKEVSAADWERVYEARNMVAGLYNGHTMFIPSYSDAVDGAKAFMSFFYSDAGYKIFTDTLHFELPMSFSDGELDTTDWTPFEQDLHRIFSKASCLVDSYITAKHDIFSHGGASPYADYKFIQYFCTNNDSDRRTADEAWNEIVDRINARYDGWLANIK